MHADAGRIQGSHCWLGLGHEPSVLERTAGRHEHDRIMTIYTSLIRRTDPAMRVPYAIDAEASTTEVAHAARDTPSYDFYG